MTSRPNLLVTYSFDATDQELAALPKLQVDAIWKRGLEDEGATYSDDLNVTAYQVGDFFERNPDYRMVLAYGAHPDAPDKKVPIGYVAAAPYYKEPERWNIDQLYTVPEVRVNGVAFDTKGAGSGLLKRITTEIKDNGAEIVDAYPLHGSETVYRSEGFAKDGDNPMLVKGLRNG